MNGSQGDQNDGVEVKIFEALSSLESVKQKVLECRYGLKDGTPMSHGEIALYLSRVTSPEVKIEFATEHSAADGLVFFNEDDVKSLEAEALRELSRPVRRAPLQN
jgi:hypothetical protein